MGNQILPKDLKLDFFRSKIVGMFSPLGFITNMKRKLSDPEISCLYVAMYYYRALITNLVANLADKENLPPQALLTQLMTIGKNYPALDKICEQLEKVEEILFEFEKNIKLKENELDVRSFMKGNGKDTSYDDHASLLLKNRLLQAINALAEEVKETFNWIDFPDSFSLSLNMTATERNCFDPNAVVPKVISFEQGFPTSKKGKYVKPEEGAIKKAV